MELRQQRDLVKIPPLIEDNLLRIGQEALTNAVKHAHAGRLKIELIITLDRVILMIIDNGCGMELGEDSLVRPGHFGVLGMYERASRIGGKLKIASAPNCGCTVSVEVPLRNASAL